MERKYSFTDEILTKPNQEKTSLCGSYDLSIRYLLAFSNRICVTLDHLQFLMESCYRICYFHF